MSGFARRLQLGVPQSASGSGGAGVNSAGTNDGEFGSSGLSMYRSSVNTGPLAVFDSGLGRNVEMSDLTVNAATSLNAGTYFRQIFTAPASGMTLNGDITFQQCIIYGAGTSSMTTHPMFNANPAGSGNITFVDCFLDGKGQSGSDAAPYPSGYGYEQLNPVASAGWASVNVLRCEMKGSTDILKVFSNYYIGYSWLHGNDHYYSSAGTATHSDHIQIDGTAQNNTVEYCTLGTPKSVALAAGTDKNGSTGPAWSQYEPLSNCGLLQVSVVNSGATLVNNTFHFNYFNDGNYGIQGGIGPDASHAGYDSVSNTIFSGNRCGPHQRFGALNGAVKGAANDGSTCTFDGTNVYDDNFTSYWGGTNDGTAGSTFTKGQVFT
jgi:hypothetical protein